MSAFRHGDRVRIRSFPGLYGYPCGTLIQQHGRNLDVELEADWDDLMPHRWPAGTRFAVLEEWLELVDAGKPAAERTCFVRLV